MLDLGINFHLLLSSLDIDILHPYDVARDVFGEVFVQVFVLQVELGVVVRAHVSLMDIDLFFL